MSPSISTLDSSENCIMSNSLTSEIREILGLVATWMENGVCKMS